MSMFSKIKRNAKAEAAEAEKREHECMAAIQAVLQSYNCTLQPVLKGTPSSIVADVQVVALQKADAPPQPVTRST